MALEVMGAIRRRSSFRRGIAWLFCLALLVPLAQSVATMHGYSHVGATADGHRDGDLAPQASHCDLCLTAAALAGGALPAGTSDFVFLAGPEPVPREADAPTGQGRLALGYLSRAPPSSSAL